MKEKKETQAENNMVYADQDDIRLIAEDLLQLIEDPMDVPINKQTLNRLQGSFSDLFRIFLKCNSTYIRLLKLYEDEQNIPS